MQNNNLKVISQSGGDKPEIISKKDFNELCVADYKVKEKKLIEEYESRMANLATLQRRKVDEFAFMNLFLSANTPIKFKGEDIPDPQIISQLERHLSKQTYETALQSFSLANWRSEIGETQLTFFIGEILHYFISQFTVKQSLTQGQIIQLCVKLISQHPHLRIMELCFVLNKAIAGDYGATYQHVGIDSLLAWFKAYYNDSADYLEGKRVNQNPNESRGLQPWAEQERQLKHFEEQQRQKKQAVEKVWGLEKEKAAKEARLKEVDAYKSSLKKDE